MNKLMEVGLTLELGPGLAFGKDKAKAEVTAPIEAKSGSKLTGKYTLTQDGHGTGKVKLKVTVEGAPEGEHAVHVHENPDCSDPDGKKAGGHWNPTTQPHGKW